MPDIKIPTEAMESVVQKAILDMLTDDDRNAVLLAAVEYLTTQPQGGSFGHKPPSPLQSAFLNALDAACRRIAFEYVEEHPELQERVRALVADAVNLALENDGELATRVRDAVSSALVPKSY